MNYRKSSNPVLLTYSKNTTADKRNVMKECTLGLIYGITAYSLSKKLKVPEIKAQQLMDKFLDMFPTLGKSMGL